MHIRAPGQSYISVGSNQGDVRVGGSEADFILQSGGAERFKIDGNFGDVTNFSTFKTGSPVPFQDGAEFYQRSDPTTAELDSGRSMIFTADGTGTEGSGDLIYAVNDAGTIKTSVIAAVSNAT
jgi:hypothetical protein